MMRKAINFIKKVGRAYLAQMAKGYGNVPFII